MNNVQEVDAHKDIIRQLSISPTDQKFATASDDSTIRIFDLHHPAKPERELKGHGSDVKAVAWHPQKGLLASGSKDSQQPYPVVAQ